MLSERKENKENIDVQCPTDTTRRNSTFSTSACKKILKSLCEDPDQHENNFQFSNVSQGELTIREMKLKQTIGYLQKKNNKQTEQITMLTKDLNTLTRIRQEQLKSLQCEMQKIRKFQVEKNNHSKIVGQLKKKNSELQNQNAVLVNKNTELEKKLTKLREILRKKQISLSEVQNKVESNDTLEVLINRQKQQLEELRESFLKFKEKESSLQQAKQDYRIKMCQSRQENQQLKTKIMILQQFKERLSKQFVDLERGSQEQRAHFQTAMEQMKGMIEEEQNEVRRLRQIIQKIKQVQIENKNNEFTQFYKTEIHQVLKQNIADKAIRQRVDKTMCQIMGSMQQSMNRILMQILAKSM